MKSNFSKKLSEIKIGISILAYGILFSFNVIAQPSGGPYGPVRQTWQLPKVDGKIYYVAPDGDKEATGEKLEKPTTIEAAFERVKTGDAIIMRGGTYRTGNLVLNQGITIQPYMDELPVMKGTYVTDQWRDLRNGLWTTKWDHLFPSAPADWWMRNNIEHITGYYPAAVKIFNQCYRVTCRDNLVLDHPYSNGIWYDVGNVDGRFLNNWVEGVGMAHRRITGKQTWPSESGFFFEISKGTICAGNVFVNCDFGIHILNSCDAQVYQNTFVNSVACFSRNERSAVGDHFGWHPATGPDVDKREGHVFINNLMSGDAGFDRPLLLVWQPPMLCEKLDRPHFKQIDHNVYVQTSDNRNTHLILWSPVKNDSCIIGFNSPVEIHELYPEFAGHSSLYKDYSVFKSPDLGNYQLIPEFPGAKTVAVLPEEIRLLLNLPKQDIPYVGAYPLVR